MNEINKERQQKLFVVESKIKWEIKIACKNFRF